MEKTIIDEKLRLEAELEVVRNELRNFVDNTSELQLIAERKRTDHRLLVDKAKDPFVIFRFNKDEEVELLDRDASEAEKIAADAKNKRQSLRERIADLEGRLKSIQIKADVKEIIEYQSRKSEIDGLIQKIRGTIEKEQQKIELAEDGDNDLLSALTAKKEALLADAALGEKVSKKALESLTAQIADEEKRLSDLAASTIDIRRGINGLKAKLAELEQELVQVDKYHKELLIAFLGQEVHGAVQEYSSLAFRLSEAFVKVATLESILNGYGSPMKALSGDAYRFSIPALGFPHSQSVGKTLFSFVGTDKQKELQAVLKKYAEDGIVIPFQTPNKALLH